MRGSAFPSASCQGDAAECGRGNAGTAGLRKLPQDRRDTLLADVSHILDASPFR